MFSLKDTIKPASYYKLRNSNETLSYTDRLDLLEFERVKKFTIEECIKALWKIHKDLSK